MGPGRTSGLFLCLLLLWACANNESPDPATTPAPDSVAPEELGIVHPGSPEPGEQAPDFALRDLEENLVRLSDLRGKPLVLNFFASWCVPCLAEMPLIEEAHQNGWVVLGIAVQDSRRAVRSLSESMELTFPMVFDADSSVVLAYEVIGPPATFFIDEAGRIVSSVSGVMDPEELERELEKLRVGSSG